ncbi:MAG: VOC family protein [Pseudomonadota bacterium]
MPAMPRILAAVMAIAASTGALAKPPAGAAVDGFGGFFFRAEDPKALATWYAEMLGVDRTPTTYEEMPWRQAAGPTVFGPFEATTTYFDAPDKVFMLNFRTKDLDALVAHLRANEIDVAVDEKTYPNGRFARLKDPEGNPIQLWEPAAE